MGATRQRHYGPLQSPLGQAGRSRKKLTAWLESTQSPFPPGKCPSPIALKIWNDCRGIDWQAIDVLAEVYGTTQPEFLIAELMAIRSFMESIRDG